MAETNGRTFQELLLNVRCPKWQLRQILREEIRRGWVEYHSTTDRYVLNGGIPEDVKRALLELELD